MAPPTRSTNAYAVGVTIALWMAEENLLVHVENVLMSSQGPIVMLAPKDGSAHGDRVLPIFIDQTQALNIQLALDGQLSPRPMTHDLMTSIISLLHAQVLKVTVTELKENTFYALLTLRLESGDIDVDSRPSDALALAVRTNAPIFASERLIDENAIEFDHEVEDEDEVVEKFRDFLNHVTPEDFLND